MNKFRNIVWYVGVLLVSLSLVLSFITNNWLLAGVCALVTAILKKRNDEVAIPKFYQDKGVTNAHFANGGKDEKTAK